MKQFEFFIKYNWKMLVSVIFLFAIAWQTYTGVVLYQSEFKHSNQFVNREVKNIETSIVDRDIENLKTILWNIRGSNTKSLQFIPSSESKLYIKSLTIGEVVNSSLLTINRPVALISSGAMLGKIIIEIDLEKNDC